MLPASSSDSVPSACGGHQCRCGRIVHRGRIDEHDGVGRVGEDGDELPGNREAVEDGTVGRHREPLRRPLHEDGVAGEVEDLRGLVVEEALADARQHGHRAALAVGDVQVEAARARGIAHRLDGDGPAPAGLEARTIGGGPETGGGVDVAEQHRDVVGALVRHGQIQYVIALQIGGGKRHRLKTDGEAGGRAETAARQAGIDQDVIAQAAGHHQVRDAVVGQVDQLDGPGCQQGRVVAVNGGGGGKLVRAGNGDVDLDLVLALVGHDHELAVGADGQRFAVQVASEHCELTRAVPVEGQEIAVSVADQQAVRLAVRAGEERHAGGSLPGRADDGSGEGAVAVVGVEPDLTGAAVGRRDQHGHARSAVIEKVAGQDLHGALADRVAVRDLRVHQGTAAGGQQQTETVRVGVERDQVGAAGAGEVARSDADGLQLGDEGGAVGADVDVERVLAGAVAFLGEEGVAGVVEQDADVAGNLIADHDVGQPIPVDVGEGDVGGAGPNRRG